MSTWNHRAFFIRNLVLCYFKTKLNYQINWITISQYYEEKNELLQSIASIMLVVLYSNNLIYDDWIFIMSTLILDLYFVRCAFLLSIIRFYYFFCCLLFLVYFWHCQYFDPLYHINKAPKTKTKKSRNCSLCEYLGYVDARRHQDWKNGLLFIYLFFHRYEWLNGV